MAFLDVSAPTATACDNLPGQNAHVCDATKPIINLAEKCGLAVCKDTSKQTDTSNHATGRPASTPGRLQKQAQVRREVGVQHKELDNDGQPGCALARETRADSGWSTPSDDGTPPRARPSGPGQPCTTREASPHGRDRPQVKDTWPQENCPSSSS